MREIGREVRETLVFIPAKAVLRKAEICDVHTVVPAGVGMGTAGTEAVPANHVQLGAAGGGGSSAAGVREAAPADSEARGASRRRDHPPGAPRAWEKGPDQELYVAVSDGLGR